MLTKNKAKSIRELHDKKGRQETGLFIVEGEKNVAELLASDFEIESLFITQRFLDTHAQALSKKKAAYTLVEQQEIEGIGTLESNDAALAVVAQKAFPIPQQSGTAVTLVLDGIRDPGNLGTIIRTADWFGVSSIVASPDCVDIYNPKVIAATRGSFARVQVSYGDIAQFLSSASVPVFGAFLEGESANTIAYPAGGILVVGSESHGISESLAPFISHKITIPALGNAESLNVAIATGIILNAWRQR